MSVAGPGCRSKRCAALPRDSEVGGPRSIRISGAEPLAVLDRGLGKLRIALGWAPGQLEAFLSGWHLFDWPCEPFTRGAYMYVPVGAYDTPAHLAESSSDDRHPDAAFARIWILDDDGAVLESQESAGLYTHVNGAHAHVPVGQFKIGRIAASRISHLSNSVTTDPEVSDRNWAAKETCQRRRTDGSASRTTSTSSRFAPDPHSEVAGHRSNDCVAWTKSCRSSNGSTGLTRCPWKPADRDLCRSSS